MSVELVLVADANMIGLWQAGFGLLRRNPKLQRLHYPAVFAQRMCCSQLLHISSTWGDLAENEEAEDPDVLAGRLGGLPRS